MKLIFFFLFSLVIALILFEFIPNSKKAGAEIASASSYYKQDPAAFSCDSNCSDYDWTMSKNTNNYFYDY